MRLFRDHGIYSQICGNALLVPKASPALNVSDAQVDAYVDGLEAIVALMHGSHRFWGEALGMARRVLDVI